MVLDLQSLFGLQVTAVPIGWDPELSPSPLFELTCEGATVLVKEVVSQGRRHLFVTPWAQTSFLQLAYGHGQIFNDDITVHSSPRLLYSCFFLLNEKQDIKRRSWDPPSPPPPPPPCPWSRGQKGSSGAAPAPSPSPPAKGRRMKGFITEISCKRKPLPLPWMV